MMNGEKKKNNNLYIKLYLLKKKKKDSAPVEELFECHLFLFPVHNLSKGLFWGLCDGWQPIGLNERLIIKIMASTCMRPCSRLVRKRYSLPGGSRCPPPPFEILSSFLLIPNLPSYPPHPFRRVCRYVTSKASKPQLFPQAMRCHGDAAIAMT